MSTFKTALRTAAAHPLYLLIYTVLISLMGVFIAKSIDVPTQGDASYERSEARVAVVDRDGSALSCGLLSYARGRYEVVNLDDDAFVLQDALAQNEVDCIVIIPNGFGEHLLDAARGDEGLPRLEAAYGASVQRGAMVSVECARWVSLAGAAAALEPTAEASVVEQAANRAARERAQVDVVGSQVESSASDVLGTYFNFSSYAIVSAVIVSTGLVFSAMDEPQRRARLAASPLSGPSRGIQVLLAGCVLAVLVWLVSSALGLVVFAGYAAQLGAVRLILALASMLGLSFVALAIAYLFSALGAREQALNALGNILGMVMTFMGGAWVPLALMGEQVQMAARFSPSYWVNDAVDRALAMPLDAVSLGTVVADTGIVVLFALALASVGLAVARTRRA